MFVCVCVAVTVHDCTAVCVCLFSRDLGLFHPAYLCQLRLLKPSQPGVHTGDSTHSTHTNIRPQAQGCQTCYHSSHTSRKRHSKSWSRRKIHKLSSLYDLSVYVSVSPLSSLPRLVSCHHSLFAFDSVCQSYPICLFSPEGLYLSFSVYLSTAVDAIAPHWRSLQVHVCVLPLLLLPSD